MEKVVVGLSGGVDSFVTALLLQKQGFEVIGVNLRLWPSYLPGTQEEELSDLCRQIDIKLYQVNGQKLFSQQVVRPFIDGYLSGTTPNPCSTCNSFVKWNLIRSLADELQVHQIATGHYVRIHPRENHHYVHKGLDPNKDQSYFLWGVREDILSRALTPLGDYTKAQVKEIAKTHGFKQLTEKRESMSICFLEGGDYRDFIIRHTNAISCLHPGPIVDMLHEPIGEHTGILHYTIGQKRGIPLKNQQPQYVAEIDAARNRLIVGDKSVLTRSELTVIHPHLINPEELPAKDIEVKVRGIGLNPEGFAKLIPLPGNKLQVHLSSPAWAVAPGQPVAFYREDRLIGGGILS